MRTSTRQCSKIMKPPPSFISLLEKLVKYRCTVLNFVSELFQNKNLSLRRLLQPLDFLLSTVYPTKLETAIITVCTKLVKKIEFTFDSKKKNCNRLTLMT